MTKIRTVILILLGLTTGIIHGQNSTDCESSECKTCKLEDRKYCTSCQGNSTKYTFKGNCYPCGSHCQVDHCVNEIGCTNCKPGYESTNSTSQSHPGKHCQSSDLRHPIVKIFGYILLFILGFSFIASIVFLIVCWSCTKDPEPVVDKYNIPDRNSYQVPPAKNNQ